MAKIHTHYDNLKVARMAPQEVIRAAYKALSQKYHPDKNPGDEKAARIMAIINSAYGTLADPQRRREHDEWIVAEEWEVEWLESTRQEEGRGNRSYDAPAHGWEEMADSAALPPRRRRDARWWAALGLSLLLGWLLAFFMFSPPLWLTAGWNSLWGGNDEVKSLAGGEHATAAQRGEAGNDAKPDSRDAQRDSRGDARNAARSEAIIDSWAVGRPVAGEAPRMPPVRVQAVSEVVLPAEAVECEAGGQTLLAPNGEAWPASSGYVKGFPIRNEGGDLQLQLNNSENPLPVFIKLYDLERRSNVRYVFILPHDQLTVHKLLLGKYEVRYQNVDLDGAGKDGCAPRKPAEPQDAEKAQAAHAEAAADGGAGAAARP